MICCEIVICPQHFYEQLRLQLRFLLPMPRPFLDRSRGLTQTWPEFCLHVGQPLGASIPSPVIISGVALRTETPPAINVRFLSPLSRLLKDKTVLAWENAAWCLAQSELKGLRSQTTQRTPFDKLILFWSLLFP